MTIRGETRLRLRRYDEALADLNRAVELDPDHADAIARRGRVHQDMERYDEALADYSRAIELRPGDAWAITGRGRVYLEMERYDEALADLSRAIGSTLAMLTPWPSAGRPAGGCGAMTRRWPTSTAPSSLTLITPTRSPGVAGSTRIWSAMTRRWPTTAGPSSSPRRRLGDYQPRPGLPGYGAL